MSMFLCQRCDEMRDSDDGCEEGKDFGLICVDCMADMEDDPENLREQRAEARERFDVYLREREKSR